MGWLEWRTRRRRAKEAEPLLQHHVRQIRVPSNLPPTGRRRWIGWIGGVVMMSGSLALLVLMATSVRETAKEERAAAQPDSAVREAYRLKKEQVAGMAGREGKLVGVSVSGAAEASDAQSQLLKSGQEGAAGPGEAEATDKAGGTGETPEGSGQDGAGVDGAGAGGQSAGGNDSEVNGKPNIIYIMVDDMGWNDIGYQSSDLSEVTPFLDKMASEGIKLDHYYSMYLCTPARAALMTGRYPYRYGLQYAVIQPGAPYGLPLGEKLLPEFFQEAGYTTHMTGKWHLGSYDDAYLPTFRGFETFLGYLNDEEDYWTHQGYSTQEDGRKFFDFGFDTQDGYYEDKASHTPYEFKDLTGVYSTKVFTDRAIGLLSEHRARETEKPLFLYVSHQAVHSPLSPPSMSSIPKHILETIRASDVSHDRKQFAYVLAYLDVSIKEMITSLKDVGLDNTLVVVASDNGGCPSSGGSNYPLRGIKHSYFEGGNRVPAFIYSPSTDIIPTELRGTTYSNLMHVTDWLPTLAHFTGIDYAGHSPIDGVNHWTALMEGSSSTPRDTVDGVDNIAGTAVSPPRTEMVYNWDDAQENTRYNESSSSTPTSSDTEFLMTVPPKGAIRVGKYKLIIQEWCFAYHSFLSTDTINQHVCQDLAICTSCGATCVGLLKHIPGNYLFDLDADPIEQINLIDSEPLLAASLYKRWEELTLDHEESIMKDALIHAAESVWDNHGECMVPWWQEFSHHNATGYPDPSGNFSDMPTHSEGDTGAYVWDSDNPDTANKPS